MFGNLGWLEAASLVLWPLVGISVPLKAVALWKAARRNHVVWFIILTVVHTVGILEVIYIFLVAKGRDDRSAMVTETTAAG